MWNLIPKKKLPPTHLFRYCCEYFKENSGADQFRITGVRQAESSRRSHRGLLELGTNRRAKYKAYDTDGETIPTEGYKVRILNPIVDWEDADVWQFIKEYGVKYCSLYDEGFTRLGCVGCPLAGVKMQTKEFERFPQYRKAYVKAFDRMLVARREAGKTDEWETGEDVMDWWLKVGTKK